MHGNVTCSSGDGPHVAYVNDCAVIDVKPKQYSWV